MIDWQSTPVYITNRDNVVRGFRHLVCWLQRIGMKHIRVIDNASTYPPLLEYYSQLVSPGVKVEFLEENLGPYAFWKMGLHGMQKERFIVTDPDVIPASGCPDNLIARMHHFMDTLPASPSKVGPSLRVDNLPSHYRNAQAVRDWEAQHWTRPTSDGLAYDALIDTTFALYHPGSLQSPATGTQYRIAPPYSFEHIPWYEDSSQPHAERDYYLSHADLSLTHWSRQ